MIFVSIHTIYYRPLDPTHELSQRSFLSVTIPGGDTIKSNGTYFSIEGNTVKLKENASLVIAVHFSILEHTTEIKREQEKKQ